MADQTGRCGPALTDRILEQGKALVRAIEALGTIKPSGAFERALARLLMAAYKQRLRAIVASAPSRVTEEILSASEHISDQRPASGVVDERELRENG